MAAETDHEAFEVPLSSVVEMVGIGVQSLAGFAYTDDPKNGGQPMHAMVLCGRPLGLEWPEFTTVIAVDLERAAAVIGELIAGYERAGLVDALRAAIDQTHAASRFWHNSPVGAKAGVTCAHCGARPAPGPDGRPVIDHADDCPQR